MTREDRTQASRRTIAGRVGAAGYAAPMTSAAGGCLNCGTNLEGEYCQACGQRSIDPDPTLREFLHELAQEILHWDGKLIATFRMLLARPGALTQEYLTARRASFISPLRLYLTCSVLFFFAKALAPETPFVIRTGAVTRTEMGAVTLQSGDEPSLLAALDRLAASPLRVKRAIGSHVGRALRHKPELRAAVTTAIPRTMFVLVPIFAALVGLVFRRRRIRYPQHLAFALHVHAFLFLALVLTLAPRVLSKPAVSAVFVFTSFASIAAYLVLAMRRVYGVNTGGAIARSVLVAATYFVAFMMAILLTFTMIVVAKF